MSIELGIVLKIHYVLALKEQSNTIKTKLTMK